MKEFHLLARRPGKPHTTELSPRDKDVAELMEKGFRNKEIATKLNLAQSTVKVYVSRVFRKLNLRIDGTGDRLALRVKAVAKMMSERPPGNCAHCEFRGFTRWAQTVAGQLLEKG